MTSADTIDERNGIWPRILRWEWVLLALVLLAIAFTRFPTLDQRLLEAHSFRQTQTAFQTLEFHRSGIDLLRPIVPVLGSPWTIPFEFPLFQALASIPMSWGLGADAANRITGLGFFVITAVALWALVRIVADRRVAAITLVVFSFSPFAILWSRGSLIEYLATAGAVIWVLAGISWRVTSDRRWIAVGAIAGAISATVKVTTAIPWVIPLLLFALPSEDGVRFASRDWIRRRLQPGFLAILALPALASLAWTLHADAVKGASPTTSWLTANALRTWNFGTISQRLSATELGTIFTRIGALIVGQGWLFLAIVAVFAVRRYRAFWLGMLLVPIAAIGTFFNLYSVHDYYLAAITPALAAILAVGIVTIARWLHIESKRIGVVLAAITLLWGGITLGFNQSYWNRAYDDIGRPPSSVEIEALTTPDEYSMVFSTTRFNWSPHIFYYANRRGMMLREPPLTVELMAAQADLDRYRLLWTNDPLGPNVEYAAVRPWFAPIGENAVLLGSEADTVGSVGVLGSTLNAGPSGSTRPLDLAGTSIACDGSASIEVGGGPGTVWLGIATEGTARIAVDEGLVALPSATRTVVLDPVEDERPPRLIRCFGGGQLTIETALVTQAEA